MAVVILDTAALRDDLIRVWPNNPYEEITPSELVSIAAATWIEFHALHNRRELNVIMSMNIEDHFGKTEDENWYRLAQSTYLMIDSYIQAHCNLANVTDVVYAGNVRDGIAIRLYGQGVIRDYTSQPLHRPDSAPR